MKIGVFDSGLGGVLIMQALAKALPQYDYCYFGDTAHVPYGERSRAEVHELTMRGAKFLFDHGCGLVIVACNTASSKALRHMQRRVMPGTFPEHKILGVLVPAAEAAARATQNGRVGVLATHYTVHSRGFTQRLRMVEPSLLVFQKSAPALVPAIERGDVAAASDALDQYLPYLQHKNVDTLILGCTHYVLLKNAVRQKLPGVKIIAQDEIVPASLRAYLRRHSELERTLSRGGGREFFVSKAAATEQLATQLFGETVRYQVRSS